MGGSSSYKGVIRRLVTAVMITHHHHPFTIPKPLSIITPPHTSFTTSSLIVRPKPPPLSASMTTTTTTQTHGDHNLDAIFAQKRVLRSNVKKDLRSMDPTLRSHEDDVIQNLILEAPWFKSSKRLCAYISCSALREVDTSKVLQHVLRNPEKDGSTETVKKLYVPRVENNNCYMRMLNISGMDDLIANSMNILEPAPADANGNDREDGLAFDRTGRRLGRGGGYYDTFLSKYQELAKERNRKQPLLIALSYSVQILEEGVIPLTPSDVFIDALVSPSGFIPISPVAQEICK